ncbi:MAG: hypothetical protein WA359_09945 [Acidimicrobiales bacterium]
MRRVLLAAFIVAAGFGIYVLPSGADSGIFTNVVLSFDFSDNSGPATANYGNAAGSACVTVGPNAPSATSAVCTNAFNVVSDVLPENTGGFVRMVAIAPASSTANNIVCPFQPVLQGQVECGFNFSANGVWEIKSQYSIDTVSGVSSVSVTSLRVTN